VPLGYARKDNGTFEPDPETVPLARRVFEMRAEGESAMRIRAMLKSQGVERSPRGVQVMLANRAYLGEIHFGDLHNLQAHEPIIDRELFDRVQRMVIPRGPRPASTRLLARLKVLRCGSCGTPLMSMKLPRQNDYPVYRCASTSDCDRHVTISAEIAEQVVVDAVRTALADAEGRASAAENAQQAVSDLKGAQGDLDTAVRSFMAAGLENEPSAVERLAALREARDVAQHRVDQIGGDAARVVGAAEDWEHLTPDEQRALIRATVESAIVAPVGRGAERIVVRLVGQ
jgi:site-specific DNA recombinase